jgi:hypothetical protein
MPSSYAPLEAHTSWAAAPLIPGDWRDLPLARALPLVLNFALRSERPEVAHLFTQCWPTRVRVMRPSFYPGWLFAEVQAALPDAMIGLCNFLYGDTAVLILDGKAEPIHKVNATGALKIDSVERATDYLRFFCSATHGGDGRFEVLEIPASVYGRGTRRSAAPDTVAAQATGVVVQPDGDSYAATAVIRYGIQVFKSHMRLDPSGMVEMIDDTPLGELDMSAEKFRAPYWVVEPSKAASVA